MRKFLLAFAFLVSLSAFAQTARSVTLTWQDTANPAGTTYNVYRNVTVGGCTPTPTLQTLVTSVTVKTYTDTNVKTGDIWCYAVTAGTGATESSFSNTAQATVKNFPPTSLVAASN